MPPDMYDFPHRVRTLGAARAERARLERSYSVAHGAGDLSAQRYLSRRIERAGEVVRALERRTGQPLDSVELWFAGGGKR